PWKIAVVEYPQLRVEFCAWKECVGILIANLARDAGLTQRVLEQFNILALRRGEKDSHQLPRVGLFDHLILSATVFMSLRSLSGSPVGGWQAVPVQRNAVGASFVGKDLANGSTGPTLPSTTLFG